MLNIILMGPPGAGKGTQAKLIAKHCGIPHISTGDLLRRNIKSGTELGKEAALYMNKGQLVPDELTIKILYDRLMDDDCSNGYILDGFPRNLDQAKELDRYLLTRNEKISLVLFIEVKPEVLMERISGRRVCKGCGAVYHITDSPSRQNGICDACGGQLIQRDDDKEETVKKRLDVYFEQTAPLIDYYEQAKCLARVDGALEIDQVTQEIKKVFKQHDF